MDLAGELHDMKNAYKKFIPFLRDMVAMLDEKNRSERDEVALRQQQGAAQALDDLLRMMDQSREEFALFKKLAEQKM